MDKLEKDRLHAIKLIQEGTRELIHQAFVKKYKGDESQAVYDDLIDIVRKVIIEETLLQFRGNQTSSARFLQVNRGTFIKYLNKILKDKKENKK